MQMTNPHTRVLRLAIILALFGGAAVHAAPHAAPAPSVRKACMPDVHRLCHGIPLLSARLKQCMKEHAEQLSDACKAAEAARQAAAR